MLKKTLILATLLLIPAQMSAMVTPLLVENTGSAATDATSNRFQTLAPHGGAARGTGDDTFNTAPISGTLSKLYVRMSTALSAGTSYAVFVRVNGASTALTCTITDAALTCSDLVNTVSVAAGDRLSMLIDPNNTPATQANVQIGVQFEGTTAGESMLLSGTQQPSASAVNYGPLSFYTTANATESNRNVLFPTSGTIDQLYVRVQNAPGTAASGRSRTVTLRKNGADTGLTCTVLETATTCTELSTSTTTAAGDIFSLSYTPTNTPATSNVTASLRFVPTTDGESVMMTNTGGNVSAIDNQYIGTESIGATSTEEPKLSVAPAAFTWRALYTQFTTAPGAGNSRSITARQNFGTSTLSANTADAAVSANDLSNTVSVAAGDLLSWVTAPVSLPTAAGTIRVSAVMFVAPGTPPFLPGQYRAYNLGTMLLNLGSLILR